MKDVAVMRAFGDPLGTPALGELPVGTCPLVLFWHKIFAIGLVIKGMLSQKIWPETCSIKPVNNVHCQVQCHTSKDSISLFFLELSNNMPNCKSNRCALWPHGTPSNDVCVKG